MGEESNAMFAVGSDKNGIVQEPVLKSSWLQDTVHSIPSNTMLSARDDCRNWHKTKP